MFTGIIQGKGKLRGKKNNMNRLIIETDTDLSDCKKGSSISCDGICLTITSIKKDFNKYYFEVNIGEETIQRSIAQYWNNNSVINIEKSLKVGDEISGHFVYGHIDTIFKVLKIKKLNSSWNYYFSTSEDYNAKYLQFIAEKGSIAINGISLTIANVTNNAFDVSIIPHTYNFTNFSELIKGDPVNIEFDALAKYVKN